MNIPNTWKMTKRDRSEESELDDMDTDKTMKHNKKTDKTTRNVRRRTFPNTDTNTANTVTTSVLHEDIVQQVRNQVNNNNTIYSTTHTDNEKLKIHTILNGISYKQIIDEVFTNHTYQNREVPLVTKAYEESFMRECLDNTEKKCAMMNDCECMKIDEGNQFIGTQFLMPGETGRDEPRMCVLCQRQITQKLYFDLMYDGMTFDFPIQMYGNICETPGEYSKEVMLFCPTNGPLHSMPYPSVSHQRNRYSVYTNYGIRYIKQHRVGVEEFSSETVRHCTCIFAFSYANH